MSALADTVVEPRSLSEFLALSPDELCHVDIGRANLLCAEGLPGAEAIDLVSMVDLLNQMAEAVRNRTEKSWRLFDLKPSEFGHSRNVFRVLMMEHVLRVQFQVQYDPRVHELVASGREWITTNSSEVFIHGILGEKRTGSCSSLPVFSIAVGRRLGYPLRLVRVPNHCLFRWDDGQERVNFQHMAAGTDIRTDEYYFHWPYEWDAAMFAINERTQVWLHSMTPGEEVSKFLCNRAILLRDVDRCQEALDALDMASRIDPRNPACFGIRSSVGDRMIGGSQSWPSEWASVTTV